MLAAGLSLLVKRNGASRPTFGTHLTSRFYRNRLRVFVCNFKMRLHVGIAVDRAALGDPAGRLLRLLRLRWQLTIDQHICRRKGSFRHHHARLGFRVLGIHSD